jgi:hypothetical protein
MNTPFRTNIVAALYSTHAKGIQAPSIYAPNKSQPLLCHKYEDN